MAETSWMDGDSMLSSPRVSTLSSHCDYRKTFLSDLPEKLPQRIERVSFWRQFDPPTQCKESEPRPRIPNCQAHSTSERFPERAVSELSETPCGGRLAIAAQ